MNWTATDAILSYDKNENGHKGYELDDKVGISGIEKQYESIPEDGVLAQSKKND